MLEPRELVVRQRLAEPVVIEPRQPLGLRKEFVDAAVGFDRKRLVVERALEPYAGELVLIFVPLAFVVLFEERAVADEPDFGLHGPVVEQPAHHMLPMVPEPATTPFFFGHNIAAAEAQVIEAVVVDAPHIDAAGGGAVQVAKAVAGVFDASAEARARARLNNRG